MSDSLAFRLLGGGSLAQSPRWCRIAISNGAQHAVLTPSSFKPPFVQLFNYVVDSPAFIGLSTTAQAALVHGCRKYDGTNNGQIAISARWLGERLGMSSPTASRALLELEDAGFIAVTRIGSFTRKNRLASEYRLTFHKCDATGGVATKEFSQLHG